MDAQERLDRAEADYERAVFAGDSDALAAGDRELDAVEAALALARGRLAHARYLWSREEDPDERALFQRAVDLYAGIADGRGEGEALFWLATYHQVVREDQGTAAPLLDRAEVLAREAGDRLTLSYVLRHQNFAAHAAGRPGDAEALLRESTDLRRELGFDAGVAANLIGHAYLAAELGRPDDVEGHLDEAERLATSAGAAGVLEWISGARDDLSP